MTSHRHPSLRGSTLVVTLAVLTALSLMAAFTLSRSMPRIRMAYQNAAWQEARVAAEGGIDSAMSDLLQNATGFNVGAWPGWKEEPPAPPVDKKGKPLPLPPPLPLLTVVGKTAPEKVAKIMEKIAKKKAKKPKKKDDPEPVAGSVVTTAPIYLDNLKVSAVSGLPAQVDVRLWALAPDAAPHNQYFRIRSMATCALPAAAMESPALFDGPLRRFSLRTVRPSLRRDDAGKPSTIGFPSVSRTVEVLVEPIYPFELAVWTGQSMSLAATGAWNVDSFDSTDDTKSNSGVYPGRGGAGVQANGHVASAQARPFESLYGPLIAANGTNIRGAASTNGGDDPATDTHENVSGALGLDATRIRNDFSREMPVVPRPTGMVVLPPPLVGSYVPGTEDLPAFYSVPGSLAQLRIAAPATGTTGAIVIMVDGNLDLAGPLIIPPNVIAILFVRGNIAFHDNVNSGPWNSNRASQLLIFGDPASPLRQAVQAYGDISVCAGFYGPSADVTLDGGVSWMGSLASSTFQVRGGGDGGIHYDEAMATAGLPVSFRISRYIEDVRE